MSIEDHLTGAVDEFNSDLWARVTGHTYPGGKGQRVALSSRHLCADILIHAIGARDRE
jgi:hypothetical protein